MNNICKQPLRSIGRCDCKCPKRPERDRFQTERLKTMFLSQVVAAKQTLFLMWNKFIASSISWNK